MKNPKNKKKITKEIDLIRRVEKEPEPKYVWMGIPEGSVGIITGVSKTGKTTFTENLAICLAVSRPSFFGYALDTTPRRVLFINLEEDYKVRSLRRIKQLKSLNAEELELYKKNFFSTPEDFPEYINTEEEWEILSEYIGDCNPEVVIIDSLTHLFKGSIEKSSECRDFIQKFSRFVRRPSLTVIIIHHNTKGNLKPIDQDCVAGSRVITAYFQFSFGLANIPSRNGGNYACMLNNKFIPKDDTTAYRYRISQDGWVELIDEVNKYDLYDEREQKVDYRFDSANAERILSYIEDKGNKGNKGIATGELKKEFIDSRMMSLPTLHNSLTKLIDQKKIIKKGRGEYFLPKENGDVMNTPKEGGSDE